MQLDAENLPVFIITAYFAVFGCFLLNGRFRDDFANWISLKDPLGFRFWFGHPLFLAISLFFFATFFYLAVKGQ